MGKTYKEYNKDNKPGGGQKLENMRVTLIPIEFIHLERSLKAWKKDWKKWESREESRPSKALLISARILRRVMETWGRLLSLKLQWKTTSLCLSEKNTKG